jgi:FAD/FMN-containing dehydrogenase
MQTAWDSADPNANSPAGMSQNFRDVSQSMQPVRDITPNGGAYQNEGDTFEPDPINSFWGSKNYDRLLALKREIDPKNLLTCHQCVGWEPSDERFSCYPQV